MGLKTRSPREARSFKPGYVCRVIKYVSVRQLKRKKKMLKKKKRRRPVWVGIQ